MSDRVKAGVPRQVMVTGAGGGIGRAVAEEFAQRGATKLWLIDLADSPVAEVADAIRDWHGCQVEVRHVDISSYDSVVGLAEEWGGGEHPDVVVNSAGIRGVHKVQDTTIEEWERTIAVNLTGAFNLLSVTARGWIAAGREGAFVNIASVGGEVGFSDRASYVASKAGVIGLIKAAALDLAAHGIRVTGISPGLIQTPMSRQSDDAFAAEAVPLGRRGDASDVAQMVVAMAENRYATGTTVTIDGGLIAGHRFG